MANGRGTCRPLRLIADSGIMWGFHTDTTEVNQYRPFTTLWFAVTGKMVGGVVVNRQTISREQALVAHTRSNAFSCCGKTTSGRSSRASWPTCLPERDYNTVPSDEVGQLARLDRPEVVFPQHENALLRVCATSACSRLIVWRLTTTPPTILPVTANHKVVKGRY